METSKKKDPNVRKRTEHKDIDTVKIVKLQNLAQICKRDDKSDRTRTSMANIN